MMIPIKPEKLMLHIGQSKTGTSALQTFLAYNRKPLSDEGILYPDIAVKGRMLNVINHNAVASALSEKGLYPFLTADDYFTQFGEQMDKTGCRHLLLSSESFFGGFPHPWDIENEAQYFEQYAEKVRNLRNYIEAAHTTLVVYLRRQDLWLESAIAHTILYQGLLEKGAYRDDDQYTQGMKKVFDYKKILDIWDEVFSPQDFIVRAYEPGSLLNGDSVDDFLKHTGINVVNTKQFKTGARENESLSYELVELKKELNQKPHTKLEERVYIDIIKRLNEKTPDKQKYRIKNSLRKDILSYVTPLNLALSQKYAPEAAGMPFFNTEIPAKAEIPQLTKDVRKAFDREYRGIRAGFVRLMLQTKQVLRTKFPGFHALLRQLKNL